MFKRRSLLRITHLLLGAVLLSQAALAIAACDWGARDAVRAVAMAAGSEDAPCHESGSEGAKSKLCVGHCLGDKQTVDRASGTLVGLAPAALVAVVLPVSAMAASHEVWRNRPLACAAPPSRILFQSFLI